MNALPAFTAQESWHIAGWTMLHYLWLGTLVGVMATLCRLLLRRAGANVRYAAALTCLAVLAGLPVGIAVWLTAVATPRVPAHSAESADQNDFIPLSEIVASQPPAIITKPAESDIIELNNSNAAQPLTSDQPNIDAATITLPEVEHFPATSQSDTEVSFAALDTFVPYLPWLWIIGTPLTFALLAAGVVGTKRLRAASRAIDDPRINDLLARLQQSLRIGKRVGIAICDRIASPVLIGIVRPIILLPPAALTGWSPDEIEMVLLHELAHVRRWDNLVNLIQRLIESLLFFHPAVWLISTWVRRERESCCDAIVVRRTERPHAYAELLVALASQMPRSVLFHPAATSAMSAGPLRTRIRRILQLEDDPMLISGKSLTLMLGSLFVAATLAVLYLPTIGQAEESTTEDTSSHSTIKVESVDSLTGLPISKFPYTVRFEAGASRFSDGDKITVFEVRGTARTFQPGNRYQIKGTYTLGSRDQAKLCAFTTAKKATEGTGPIQEIQTTLVGRGKGNFTLVLPLSRDGWPHISFYPSDGGDTFGGIYFGTGNSVLKKWWGAGDVVDRLAKSTDEVPVIDVLQAPSSTIELKPDAQSLDHAHQKADPKQRIIERLPDDIVAGELIAVIDSMIDSGQAKGMNILIALPPQAANLQFEIAKAMRERHKAGKIADASTAWIQGDKIELIVTAPQPKSTSSDDSDEQHQVIATVPSDLGNETNLQQFAKAYVDARKNKHYVEFHQTPDGRQLIVVPEPNDANWPDVLGRSPRKDRVIAERAYARLGLKLAPLTDAEISYRELTGKPPGVLVVGGNVPEGLPLPSVLTSVGDRDITSMNNLLHWMESDQGQSTSNRAIKCYANADGHEYLFDAAPPVKSTFQSSANAEPDPDSFDLERGLKVLLFHSADSKPAKDMRPIFDEVVKEFPAAHSVLVDTTHNKSLVEQFDVGQVPTVLVLQEGKVRSRVVGLQTADSLRKTLAEMTKRPVNLAAEQLRADTGAAAPSPNQAAAADRRLIAYEIPSELTGEIGQLAKTRRMEGIWDERNRFVVQASREEHAGLNSILKATPAWRDPAAAQERAKQPLVMRQQDGEPVVEWRSAGLTFKRETRPEYMPRTQPGLPTGGCEIINVAPGSPADWQSIRIGDSLGGIERFRIGNLEELKSVMDSLFEGFSDKSKSLRLLMLRRSSPGGLNFHEASMPLRPDELALEQADRNRRIQESRQRQTQDAEERRRESELSQPEAGAAQPSANQNQVAATDASPAIANPGDPSRTKSALRYDGKSFEEWRDALASELSTKERTAAVKALAAFGANGLGREASKAILELVPQYDWRRDETRNRDDIPAGDLQSAIVTALSGGDTGLPSIPVKYWLPVFFERFKSDPNNSRLQQFALMAFSRQRRQPSPDVDFKPIIKLAREKSSPVSSMALVALAAVNAQHRNPNVTAFWQQLFKDGDPAKSGEAMSFLKTFSDIGDLKIDWLPLLLHKDESVQKHARNTLSDISRSNLSKAKVLLPTLLEVLEDPKQSDNHLPTIRALATIFQGDPFDQAFGPLTKLSSDHEQPMPIRIAATVAKMRMTTSDQYKSDFIERFADANKNRQDSPEFTKELQQLEEAFKAEEALGTN